MSTSVVPSQANNKVKHQRPKKDKHDARRDKLMKAQVKVRADKAAKAAAAKPTEIWEYGYCDCLDAPWLTLRVMCCESCVLGENAQLRGDDYLEPCLKVYCCPYSRLFCREVWQQDRLRTAELYNIDWEPTFGCLSVVQVHRELLYQHEKITNATQPAPTRVVMVQEKRKPAR